MFQDAAFLQRLMAILVPHGMLSFSSGDVLRYFWKRVNRTGALPASFNGGQQIKLPEYRDGKRVKDGWEGNSSKFYDKLSSGKGNVLRAAQTTMNRVNGLREYQPKEGGRNRTCSGGPGAKASPVYTGGRKSPKRSGGGCRRCALGVTTKTYWRPSINHGDFLIHGCRHRDLQRLLYCTPATSDTECRRRSATIGRKLGLLKAHGLIRKIQHTQRYQVSKEGQTILVAVLTTARTTLQQINPLQVAA